MGYVLYDRLGAGGFVIEVAMTYAGIDRHLGQNTAGCGTSGHCAVHASDVSQQPIRQVTASEVFGALSGIGRASVRGWFSRANHSFRFQRRALDVALQRLARFPSRSQNNPFATNAQDALLR